MVIGDCGYATTIGCTQFREHLLDREDLKLETPKLVYLPLGGRQETAYMGKPGRPKKIGKTTAGVERMK